MSFFRRARLRQGDANGALAAFARFAADYDTRPEGPDNRLDWADALLHAGRTGEARAVLEGIPSPARDGPARAGQDYQLMLGRLFMADRDWDKAQAAFQPLAAGATVPDALRAQALLALADIAEARADRVAALAVLDAGLARLTEPGPRGLCQVRKGRLLLAMDKVEDGLALIRGYVADQHDPPMARAVQLDAARTLLDKALPDKALVEFQNYLETFSDAPGVTEAQQGKGTALFQLSRFAEAAAAFEKAAETTLDPAARARIRMSVGDAHFAAGQYKLAVEAYAQAAALWPESPLAAQAAFQTAECMARLGDLDRANALFWDLVDRDADDPLAAEAMLRIAGLALRRDDWPAARVISEGLARHPDGAVRARARLALGILAYRTNRLAEALAQFEQVRALPADPVSGAQADYLAAWCLFRLGRDAEAVAAFRAYADARPDSAWAPDALFWLSEHAWNQARHGPAETGFLTVAGRYPASALADTALFWAGRAALLQNEFRRANAHFARLIKEYPGSRWRPDARFFQAAALGELGEFDAAILIYDELIRQFPDHPRAEPSLFRRGDCQFALGAADPRRYQEAAASYQAVLDAPAPSPGARLEADYKIGRCLEKTGQADDAFERYMNAVHLYAKLADPAPADTVWFTRAAFQAAALKEAEQGWRKAAGIDERVADADVPASPEARERLDRLRRGQWLLFY